MDKKKRQEKLRNVPTRRLVASIKKDLKRQIRASASAKRPKK